MPPELDPFSPPPSLQLYYKLSWFHVRTVAVAWHWVSLSPHLPVYNIFSKLIRVVFLKYKLSTAINCWDSPPVCFQVPTHRTWYTDSQKLLWLHHLPLTPWFPLLQPSLPPCWSVNTHEYCSSGLLTMCSTWNILSPDTAWALPHFFSSTWSEVLPDQLFSNSTSLLPFVLFLLLSLLFL